MQSEAFTKRVGAVIAFVACAVVSGNAMAQQAPASGAYPAKVVRIIVPWPAGGGIDVLGRTMAAKLTESFGQQVLVENRIGANGMIGSASVAKAPADGYTLLFDSLTSHAINPHLYPAIPFSTQRDFSQAGLVALLPYILVGHPSLPANIRDFIALAKKNPGRITVASYGNGSASHLAAELFQQKAGVKFLHVPYKGAPPAITDTIAGEVMVHFSSFPPALPFIKSGRLRAYAMATNRRTSELPDLPTIEEALGFKGYNVATELGLMAPTGTPEAIVTRLNGAIIAMVAQPDVKARLATLGFMEGPKLTPEQTAAHYRSEFQHWGKVIKDANVKID